MRAILGFGSICLTLVAAGCGSDPGTGSCSAATCGGCCKGGQCITTATNAACGLSGKSCATCLAGTTCVNGQCKAGTCGGATCPTGCCNQQGDCLIYSVQNSMACGTSGATCQSCGALPCVSGACQTTGCSSSNCAGCCNGQTCLPYPQQGPTTCGMNGAACLSCGSGQCVNGQCLNPTCNTSTCSQGCCNAQGQCVLYPYQSTSACGTGATLCQPCSGQCVNGQCQTATCNATNCSQGCCNAQGLCILWASQSASACGTGANMCQPCSGQCVNGQCQTTPACSGATCAQGCCTLTKQCIPWAQQTAGACGTAGNPCQTCTGVGVGCASGLCQNVWKVSVISAIVKAKSTGTDTWDGSGSISGPEPDPYVIVKVNSSGKSGQTKYIDDSYNPVYNQQVLTESEQALSFGVTCEVREDDGILPSELMGTCPIPSVTAGMLAAGQATLDSVCTSYVTSVTLGFSK